MATITSCIHHSSRSSSGHFFDSFYSDQPLVLKIAKVFFVCLAAVVVWVAIRAIKSEPVVEGRLWIYLRSTGCIGKDQMNRFGETLQLQNGNPLQVAATDLYVNTMIRYKGKGETVQELLPSSLFAGAREGDSVCFRRKGKLHRLILEPLRKNGGEISFEECLRNVEIESRCSFHEFYYEDDVPDSYKRWSLGIAPIFLSTATRQIVVGQKGAMPIDLDALQRISTKHAIDVLSKGKLPGQNIFQYQLSAIGQPKITILVDRNHLYVHTFREIVLEQGSELVGGSLQKEYFLNSLLVEDGAKADLANIEAALDDKGVLTINIPPITSIKEEI
jgi:hypothetical protein